MPEQYNKSKWQFLLPKSGLQRWGVFPQLSKMAEVVDLKFEIC
jgi:hypothetical protein